MKLTSKPTSNAAREQSAPIERKINENEHLNTKCSPQRTDLVSDDVISKMMLKSSDDHKAFQHVLHHGSLICWQRRDRGSVLIWLGEMTTLVAS